MDLSYNPDFEWYEAKVFISNESINLFVPGYVDFDLSEVDKRFASIKSWIKQNRIRVDKLCSKKLSALLYENGEKKYLEKERMTLRSLSLEKGNAFELLMESKTYQKYVTLFFDGQYELLRWKLDF